MKNTENKKENQNSESPKAIEDSLIFGDYEYIYPIQATNEEEQKKENLPIHKKNIKSHLFYYENFEEKFHSKKAIIFFFTFFFGLNLISNVFNFILSFFIKDQLLLLTLSNLIPSAISIVIILTLFLVKDRNTLEHILKKKLNAIRVILITILGSLLMFGLNILFAYLSQLLYKFIYKQPMHTNTNQTLVEMMIKKYKILSFFSIVILAPINEELIYRLFFINMNKKKPVLMLILGGLLFALIHFDISSITSFFFPLKEGITDEMLVQNLVTELLNLPSYLIAGLGLSMMYLTTNTIYSTLSFHIANNLLSYIQIVIQASQALLCTNQNLL